MIVTFQLNTEMLTKATFSLNIIITALACTAPLLTELERRARNYIADGTIDPYVNDYILVDQWYNVTEHEQQHLMPDSTTMPDDFTCGGYEPIYIKGTHPDIKTLTTTPVNVKTCLKSTFDDCDIEYNIKVRKCNKDIQYYLVATKQHASYCFDPPGIQNGKTKFSDPPKDVKLEFSDPPKDVKLGNVTVKPILDFDEQDKNITVNGASVDSVNYTPFVKFVCDFLEQVHYFHAVNWYLNGALYKVLGPTQNMEELLISEKTMHRRKHINLGFTLKCGVRVSVDKTGRATTMVSSPDYFAGIKILNPRIDLPKNSQSTVQFQVTVPVGCRYNSRVKEPACDMALSMFDPNGYKCNKANILQVKNSRRCGLDIKGAVRGEIWNYSQVYNFTVDTSFNNYNDKRDFVLQLKASPSYGHKWWNNYQPDNIKCKDQVKFVECNQMTFETPTYKTGKIVSSFYEKRQHLIVNIYKVVVHDTDLYKNKTCYAHVDPHMQTADGYNYECQEQGEYLMYRNVKYRIEVLMKTDKCNNGIAQCICHLIIRAGADVFSINLCQTPRFINFLSCADGGILRVIKKHDKFYQVHTPIATQIDITIHGPGTYDGFMNVDIHMAPKDSGNTEGLCGYMDGNKINDLTERNKNILKQLGGSIYSRHHPNFIRSWRLKGDENLFKSDNIKHIQHWDTINAKYCVCEQAIVQLGTTLPTDRVAKALCSSTQYLDCDLARPTVTNQKCNKITRRRRSVRSTRDVTKALEKHRRETERLLRLASRPRVGFHQAERRSVAAQNISESEARIHCGNVINSSHVVSDIPDSLPGEGSKAVIDQCIFDVMTGNDLSLADVHVDAMNTIALAKIKLDPVYVANNTAEVKTFIKNSCPGNCSQKGNCSNEGKCECDTYFHSSDCSVDERDPLVIDDLEGGGLCNLTDGDGCECFYVRTKNLLSNFTCAVSGVITYIDGTEENITTSLDAGEYEDIFTGLCCAPKDRMKRTTIHNFEFSTRYDIAVSNDGQTFGAAEPLHVYDSKCQDALPTAEDGYRIVLKDGFCFIDGICVANKDARVSDDCFTCEPDMSVYNWTRSCAPTDPDDGDLGVILGATIGSVASVLVGVGMFSLWHFKLKPQHKKRKSVGDSQIFSNKAMMTAEHTNR